MGRKQPNTTNTMIRSALRRLFLRSRERAATLKRDNYTCTVCGKKQSRAKGKEVFVEVHHRNGIQWSELFDQVRKYLLCNPDDMITHCVDCHKKEETKT